MGYVKISFVPFLMLLKPPFWSWLSGKQKHYYLLWHNLPRIKLVSLTPFKVEKKLYSRKSLNSKVKFWKEPPPPSFSVPTTQHKACFGGSNVHN